MKLQYISDSTGQTTGILIPIDEWEIIVNELSIQDILNIPQKQIDETTKRIAAIKKGLLKTRNWEDAKKDIFIK